MDRDEAGALLRRELARWAERTYEDLAARVGASEAYPVDGASGEIYQVELDVRWDARAAGAIRILGAIDDGRLPGAISPLSDDVIVHPDGRFEEGRGTYPREGRTADG